MNLRIALSCGAVSKRFSPSLRPPTASLSAAASVPGADVEHAGAAQPRLLLDLLIGVTRLAQPDHLHAPFVPRLARQRSHVRRFHHPNMMAHLRISSALGPDQ
jgi:hypothetical protein